MRQYGEYRCLFSGPGYTESFKIAFVVTEQGKTHRPGLSGPSGSSAGGFLSMAIITGASPGSMMSRGRSQDMRTRSRALSQVNRPDFGGGHAGGAGASAPSLGTRTCKTDHAGREGAGITGLGLGIEESSREDQAKEATDGSDETRMDFSSPVPKGRPHASPG